jgi:transcriptional regulator with XRE-family HTH domain
MASELGRRLKKARISASQTQTEAAEELGVTQQTVAAWEAGKRPAPDRLDSIADYLQMSREELLPLVYPPDTEADLRSDIAALRTDLDEVKGLLRQVIRNLNARGGGRGPK